jgi:chondroitin AC lyase
VGAEAGNGDGEFNFYSGNGTNYIFVTGKEYGGEYFKRFNYRQFPGITAEQDDAVLPVNDWGAGGLNGNSFAGGVSDSTNGACGMILDKRGIKAHKAWFYFDTEFVCLGAGINQNDGKSAVYTTLNQSNAAGPVQYSVQGKTSGLKEPKSVVNPDWVLHGRIGYFNLDPTSTFELACDTSLFSANINHGINPKDKTYAYLIKPGVQSGSEAAKYQIPVKILSNTAQLQAVQHNVLNLVEVIFYQPGTLKMENGDVISVDSPCAMLWNLNKKEIHVANPRCESENPTSIHLKIIQNKQEVTYSVTLPVGDFAGRSVTLKI